MQRQFFIAQLFTWAASAKLSLTLTHSSSISTSVQCATQLQCSSAKGSIPTTTKTTQLLPDVVLVLTKSTPTLSVTPSPVLSFETQVETSTVTISDAAVTDTFSTTSTVQILDTITTQVTSTTTETDISTSTYTQTVTIEPSPGFVPVDQSAGTSNYGAKVKRMGNPHGSELRARGQKYKSQDQCTFAAAVTCTDYLQPQWTEEVIIVMPSVTTTLAPSTIVSTVTSTATSTSTLVPAHVTETLSFTATESSTITITSTEIDTTTTSSSVVATVTANYYAACGPDNLLGPQVADGSYIDSWIYVDTPYDMYFRASSAYDCCVACITNPVCPYSFWQNGQCTAPQNEQCSDNYVAYISTDETNRNIVVSNGYCGSISL